MRYPSLKIVAVFTVLLCMFLLAETLQASSDALPDSENCLYCHRYPQMGRYDEKGKKRIFYINDRVFARSIHGKLSCKSCHVSGLDQIPHTDIQKVDCTTKCHIKEPSTNQEFSHANIVQKVEASVHGRKNGTKPYPEDLPECKSCHDNPLYSSLEGLWCDSEALSNETLARCTVCHVRKEWADNFYAHFMHRMQKQRTQKEIVQLCTGCHEDQEKMNRHGLESIETYKDTFHWKQVKYRVENAPDCITCHVPVGYSTHEMYPRTDPRSPLHMNNRVNTCAHQGGIQTCHPGATPEFAMGRVHAYGANAEMAASVQTTTVASRDDEKLKLLVQVRAKNELSKKEVFHYQVLHYITLFYKILIGSVIGFMILHQFLDYRRTRKRMNQRHHSMNLEKDDRV
ncbi:MAG: hypothetical protein C0403_04405 [Desulfobacterium sp.]|nr:hypothetical protein [Desulfobacterium sp.]